MEDKNKEYTAFKVEYTSYTQEISEVDPDDKWSRASTSTDHDIKGIKVVDDNSFNCIGSFKVNSENSEIVYLVYGIYSSGDSFGHDSGKGIEFVEVFKTREKAERCVEQIQANADLFKLMSNHYSRSDSKKIKDLLEKLHNSPTINDEGKISSEQLYVAFYQDEKDETKKFSCPWNGYFETLDNIDIQVFDLSLTSKPSRKRKF